MDKASSNWVIDAGLREIREHPFRIFVGDLIERATGHPAIWERDGDRCL